MISKQKYYAWLIDEVHITRDISIFICSYLGEKIKTTCQK